MNQKDKEFLYEKLTYRIIGIGMKIPSAAKPQPILSAP